MNREMTRRRLMKTIGAVAGAAIAAPKTLIAQAGQAAPVSPPTVISNPPRDFGPDAARRRTSPIRTS